MNRNATSLKAGGFTRLSTCDWPGELAATVFCQGCAWDCPYCHNPALRAMDSDEMIPWQSIREFLVHRRGLLDAVVFSGGEPTLQSALIAAVVDVRELGYRVGLHTAGIVPERFADLLPWLDWVGFDIKGPFALYPQITGVGGSGDLARRSLRYLLASGTPYEVRTTVPPSLLATQDMLDLKSELLDLGVENYVVQAFRTHGVRLDRLPNHAVALILPEDYGRAFLRFRYR